MRRREEGVQNLRVSDSPAAPAALPAPPPSTMENSRRPPRLDNPKRQCGPDPAAHKVSPDQGLMQHMGQKHGGEQLLPESVGQLRHLDRASCVVCGAVRSQRCNRCGLCQSNTPIRELRVGDTFQDRLQPRHQSAAPGGAPGNLLRARSQCSQVTLLTTARFQIAHSGHCPHRARQAATRRASPSLRDGTPAMRGLSTHPSTEGWNRRQRQSYQA